MLQSLELDLDWDRKQVSISEFAAQPIIFIFCLVKRNPVNDARSDYFFFELRLLKFPFIKPHVDLYGH